MKLILLTVLVFLYSVVAVTFQWKGVVRDFWPCSNKQYACGTNYGASTAPPGIDCSLLKCQKEFESSISTDKNIVNKQLDANRKPIFNNTNFRPSFAATNGSMFNTWFNNVVNVNYPLNYDITFDNSFVNCSQFPSQACIQGLTYGFINRTFFPLDDKGWGNYYNLHNYGFTYEIKTRFTYTGNETFFISGSDDIWLFINNILAIDLGGVHTEQNATLILNQSATDLGLVKNNDYNLDLFYANRHTNASSLTILAYLSLSACPKDWCGVCFGDGQSCCTGCNTGSLCTVGACNATNGLCYNTTVSVDDGNPCTIDFCNATIGVYHTPIICTPPDACLVPSCSPTSGCQFTTINCDDGILCTNDSCDPFLGCKNVNISCDDGNDCTRDSCDPTSGCLYVEDCDDQRNITVDYCDRTKNICAHLILVQEVTSATLTTQEITSNSFASASITTSPLTTSVPNPKIKFATILNLANVSASIVFNNQYNTPTPDQLSAAFNDQCPKNTVPSNCTQNSLGFKIENLAKFSIKVQFKVEGNADNLIISSQVGGNFPDGSMIGFYAVSNKSDVKDYLLFKLVPINSWVSFSISLPSASNYIVDGVVTIRISPLAPNSRDLLSRRDDDNPTLNLDMLQLQYQAEDAAIADAPPKKNNTKSITIGVVVGGLVLIAIIAVFIVYIVFYRKKKTIDEEAQARNVELSAIANRDLKEVTGIKVGKEIGGGNFGTVYIGTSSDGVSKVALKKLNTEAMSEFVAEAKITDDLNHPNIVYFMGLYTDSENDELYLVTEFCTNGSLLSYLQKKEKHYLSEPVLLKMAHEASKGLAYLEERGVVHRDLAARNLLLQGEQVKVADFGLSRSAQHNYTETSTSFPIRWTAPESLIENKFTSKSDVWSMGITMIEIFTFGELPYRNYTNREVIEKVVDNGEMIDRPTEMSDDVWELISQCLSRDPEKRPKLCEIATQLDNIIKSRSK